MDDFNNTLTDLKHKYDKFDNSEKHKIIIKLKSFITNLEDTPEVSKLDKSRSYIEKDVQQPSLKLTIKKNKVRYDEAKVVVSQKPALLFSCKECRKTFSTMKKMMCHVLATHEKMEVTCKSCKGTFHSYSLLVIHECFYSSQTLFVRRKCGICDMWFLEKHEYQSHMLEAHHMEISKLTKLFSCTHCKSSFKLRSQLMLHISNRHKDFTSKRLGNSESKSRAAHQRSHKAAACVEPTNAWCSACKRSFITDKVLARHLNSYNHRVKTGELSSLKRFICDTCGKYFPKMSNLQRHVGSHHNELVHKCSLCDYRTAEKCNLAEHMRRHYQIRSFGCEFCDATFIAKRELKDHIAFKHSSARSFECKDCGKMFKTRRMLTRHAKTHLEVRPCVCACGSSFVRLNNLRRHMLAVHHDHEPSITRLQPASVAPPGSTHFTWFADSDRILVKVITAGSIRDGVDVASRERHETGQDDSSDEQDEEPQLPDVDMDSESLGALGEEQQQEDGGNSSTSGACDSPVAMEEHPRLELEKEDVVDEECLSGDDDGDDGDDDDDDDDEGEEHTMNICSLEGSPPQQGKIVADLGSYKVESIIMESDARAIWRPMDQPDSSSSLLVVSADGVQQYGHPHHSHHHHHAGIISSFSEVFLTPATTGADTASQSGPSYTDDDADWGPLGSTTFLLTTEMLPSSTSVSHSVPAQAASAAEPVAASSYYSPGPLVAQQQQYLDSYSAPCPPPSCYHHYSVTTATQPDHSYSKYSIPDHSSAALFQQQHQQPWPVQQSSPFLDYNQEPQQQQHHSYGQQQHHYSLQHMPPRILSPIDFLVADPLFAAAASCSSSKSDFCFASSDLSLHIVADTPLLSDYGPSSNHHPHHQGHHMHQVGANNSSKNFSVVNLISSAAAISAAAAGINKDCSDELLYSETDDNPL